jgi:hypothetical protein
MAAFLLGRPCWRARAVGALRQSTFIGDEAELIAGGCRQLGEALLHAEIEGGSGTCSQRDRRVSTFNQPERSAADNDPRGHVGSCKPALAPCEREVST